MRPLRADDGGIVGMQRVAEWLALTRNPHRMKFFDNIGILDMFDIS